MNIRMKRGMALVLMASLLLAGSAQALFGLGKSKPETVSPENGPTARDLEIRTYRGHPPIWGSWRLRTLTAGS